MRKLVVMMLFAFVSSNAMAAWVLITMSDDKNTTIYGNPDTVSWSSNKVKLSIMYDNKMPKTVPGFKSYFSTKDQFEVDCNEDQSRLLGLIAFSGNMGAGEVIYTHNFNNDWSPVTPNRLDQDIFKFACSLKSA